jgi:cytochrome P450
LKDVSHKTIFHEIIGSNLPHYEKSASRLWQDGQVTVAAGTLTTAWALSIATFHLISQPAVLRKLKAELARAIPDPESRPSLAALEQLPYLTGVVQECLRLSYGVSMRLPRICPDETLIFSDGSKDWAIPPGTPISMTSTLIHHNESIFPNSHSFLPERWIEKPHLDRYLVSFSKGSRHCIGINLAYAELYLALARIYRSWGSKEAKGADGKGVFELYETTWENDVRFPWIDSFLCRNRGRKEFESEC